MVLRTGVCRTAGSQVCQWWEGPDESCLPCEPGAALLTSLPLSLHFLTCEGETVLPPTEGTCEDEKRLCGEVLSRAPGVPVVFSTPAWILPPRTDPWGGRAQGGARVVGQPPGQTAWPGPTLREERSRWGLDSKGRAVGMRLARARAGCPY